MQTRSVSEMVKTIKDSIVHLSAICLELDAARADKKMLYLLQSIESRMAFRELLTLLEAQSANQEPVSATSVFPFYQFLAARWQFIQNTDSAYPIAPRLPINRACQLLAEQLAPVESKHRFSILMPTVVFEKFPEKLHQFIISPTLNKALMLTDCFKYLEKRDTTISRANSRSSRLSVKQETSTDITVLTMHEEHLINTHSSLAAQYANAIILQRDLGISREVFLAALNSDDYEVIASYGEAGKMRLLDVLTKHIRSPIGLSEFLYSQLPKQEWMPFLELFDHKTLFKIILGIDLQLLQKATENNDEAYKKLWQLQTDEQLMSLSRANFQFKHEDELRALMICLMMVYRISRKEGPEFKSTLGGYVGSLFSSVAQSREQKIESCDVYCRFLLADPVFPLDDLTGYLKSHQLYQKHATSLTGSSVLPSLVLLAARLCKQFKKEQQKITSYGTLLLSSK